MLIQSVNSGEIIDVNLDDEKLYYKEDFDYAKEHDEVDQFRESYRKDIRCGAVIDETISEHFDGRYLRNDVLKPVMEEFCPERISHVLADTVVYAMDDGRISRTTKEWARQENPNQKPNTYEDHLVILQSHPAVLNGFIDLFRKELDHIETIKKTSQERQEQIPEFSIGRSR